MVAAVTAAPTPRVRVVVVNYNGGDLTYRAVERLVATRWPADRLELVVVDNASTDGVRDRLRGSGWPVTILRNKENLGFAGGCNLAMRDRRDVDFIALVNSDALVEPDWLDALVREAGPRVGAVNPKILLADRYRRLTLEVNDGEHGVRVSGMKLGGSDVWAATEAASGTLGAHLVRGGRAESTTARAEYLVPDAHGTEEGHLSVRCDARVSVDVRLQAGGAPVSVRVGRRPQWIDVPYAGAPADIVNSAGALVTPECFGADRGYLEPDTGQFDEPASIESWTGCVVLLSVPYLDEVGVFDERMFLYYEDFDLAWRGRRHGWTYRYTPATTVRHVRGASTRDHDWRFLLWNQRNRLVAITKNAPRRDAVALVAGDVRVTAGYALRDVLRPLVTGHRPDTAHVRVRAHAFASFLRLLPGSIRQRG
jgi:GT2 family glycosyltransferase